jgi:hypothetical protein
MGALRKRLVLKYEQLQPIIAHNHNRGGPDHTLRCSIASIAMASFATPSDVACPTKNIVVYRHSPTSMGSDSLTHTDKPQDT